MLLKDIRYLRDMTQTELQWKSSVLQGRISKQERGLNILSDEEKERIARALGLSVNAVQWTPKNRYERSR